MATKRMILGRDLNALLGKKENEGKSNKSHSVSKDIIAKIGIDKLQPGKYQPRSMMDERRLSELADSIREQGILQPILVRGISADKYEILAGERRWQAAKLAGLKKVPCIVHHVESKTALVISLLENIQREDLTVLEEAEALQKLIQEFSLTHQQAAKAVGKSRATVSNLLRLLELPETIREYMQASQLEMGHARALLTVSADKQQQVADQIIRDKMSVRETEHHIRSIISNRPHKVKNTKSIDENTIALQNKMAKALNTKVVIKPGTHGQGQMVVYYNHKVQLENLLQQIEQKEIEEI